MTNNSTNIKKRGPDDIFPDVFSISLYRCCSYYLMSSFLYYVVDDSILHDWEYDHICLRLFENFDDFEHPHKYLLDVESLRAGTGYNIKFNYPIRVMLAAYDWQRRFQNFERHRTISEYKKDKWRYIKYEKNK